MTYSKLILFLILSELVGYEYLYVFMTANIAINHRNNYKLYTVNKSKYVQLYKTNQIMTIEH